jgi:tape measure domain-containing protein
MPGQTFTTYINAKRTGSIDSEFAQLGAAGTRELGKIQKKAQDASRAIAGLTGGRGAGGRSLISQSYINGFDQAKIKADRLADSQARLAREQSGLVRALRTTGNTLQVVQGPLGPIAGRVTAAADALVRLTGVTLGLAGAGAVLFAYVRAANRFVEVRSKLATLYDSQKDVNSAMGEVYGIAQRARAGLAPVADLYAKLKLNADQFGFSQQRVTRLTELASKAATLSGGTAQSREAGLYQFAQAVGSNNLGGDELRSVKENIPALARELSLGLNKLPEFKGQNISIGQLKKLASEGKLTADVIARAMEAAAGDIETRFARLPPTLGQAFNSLSNSATMFVGRFEESTHIVGNLASGIMLLGNNLNVVVGIAGGVAAGFAAIIAAGKFKEIGRDIGQTITNLRQQQTTTRANLETAVNMRTATVQQNVALAAQEAQIRKNIIALEAELRVQQELAAQGSVSLRAGLPGGAAMAAAGQAGSARVTRELADEVEHLSVVQTNAATSGRKLEGQHKAVDVATKAASKSSSLLKSGLSSLVQAINPVGIAVALATTAFLEWAMAESEAEKNAKKVEDAQRSLATVIDFASGKVREQNELLLANARLAAGQGIAAANQQHLASRSQIYALGAPFRPRTELGAHDVPITYTPQVTASQSAFLKALDQFKAGGSVQALQQFVESLAKQDPAMRGLADQVTRLAGDAQKASRDVGSLQSAVKIIGGTATAEDIRRAQGDFSGGRAIGETKGRDVAAEAEALRHKLADQRFAAETQMNESLANLEKRRSQMTVDDYIREKAQIEATYDSAIKGIDKRDAAEEERRRKAHERELARIEAENKAREERTDKRKDALGRWSDEPAAIVRAAKDIRELNELVGQTMNGLSALTKDNPLGQGIYTADMAAQDAQHIQEGLLKPYRQYMEQRQQDLALSSLIADGHDLEAEALRQVIQLHDQIGQVSMDQYRAILASIEAEERMNDTLAQRERILAPLRQSVETLRGSIASAIEQIESGGNPLKAGKNLLKGIFQQFNQASAAQLAEKITGGLDSRVRDLLRGSISVDGKIADYLTALNSTSQGADNLSSNLNTAADAARNAAAALNAIAGAPGAVPGGIAGALGAGGASIMGPAAAAATLLGQHLPSSFYKQGAIIGSGAGDNIIYRALGGLGAVITENLRSQKTQDRLYAQGKTKARISDHTTTNETWDVRLPRGVSYQQATALVQKQAKAMGYEVAKALDETVAGGTGPHAHYVFAAAAKVAAAGTSVARDIGGGPAPGSDAARQAFAADIERGLASLSGSKAGGAKGVTVEPDGSIVITGSGMSAQRQRSVAGISSPEAVWNKIGGDLGSKLDKVFGTKFLSGIGSKLGTALSGASYGNMASSVVGALGLKQSNLGSSIGGAAGGIIGSIIPGVGTAIGGIIGGVLGGTLGGLFKKTKQASATISGSGGLIDVGSATGTGSAQKAAAGQLAGSVGDALQQIADQLHATIGSFAVSIGVTKKGKYVVDEKGLGRLKTGGGPDDTPEFDTEAEAIQYALMNAIQDGAITGLSAASQVILRKAKDLTSAMNKVLVIESIPRRLMALKDPVRAAVMDLNDEFSTMISYLKEGGATAEQYAQAQELYNLERQKAVDSATAATTNQIQDYINEMLGGTSSPLNKRTVYENAQAALNPLATDVRAGRAVDSDALLKAVSNFQQASQELNGSSSSFFDDFNSLLGLLNLARNNITGSVTALDPARLPPSPFDDASIQAIINGTTGTIDAINVQTDILGALLQQLVNNGGGGGSGSVSAIDALPGGRFSYDTAYVGGVYQ